MLQPVGNPSNLGCAGKDAHGAHGKYLSRLLAQSESGFFVNSGVTIAGGAYLAADGLQRATSAAALLPLVGNAAALLCLHLLSLS
jgi:hypothetical protein